MQAVDSLFVEKEGWYVLNEAVPLVFQNEQEAASFLVEAIRTWKSKGLFLSEVRAPEGCNVADIPEDELYVTFRYFRRQAAESYFEPTIALQERILPNLTELSFVRREVICDCGCGHVRYGYPFRMLEFFAKEGREGLARRASAELAEEQRRCYEEQSTKLAEQLGDVTVSEELWQQILPYADTESLVIARQDVAVVLTARSEYGSSGGVGYYDQVRVFCGSQSEMQEWQWRDRYSADNDKPWLKVNAIGKVSLSKDGDKVVVKVELVNKEHGNRTATYTFDSPQPTAVRMLSVDEQVTFATKVEQEIDRVIAEFNQLWERKSKMVNPRPMGMGVSDGYVSYRRPSIKQREVHPEIGVAAFVTEEQIDHRVSDPQIRYELFVFTAGSERAVSRAEDHGYEREGGAFLVILEVNPEQVVINTKNGGLTIVI